MSSNQTIQIDSDPPILQTLSAGTSCEAVLSVDSQNDRFELRVLRPGESIFRTIDRVSRQISLIELAEHPSIRGITQPLSNSAPYSFGLSLSPTVHPSEDRLDRVLDTLNAPARIQVASQLVAAIAEAHRVGLYHGSLAAETVLVDQGVSPIQTYVDFSATSFDEAISVEELSVEQDLSALRCLIRKLLLPVVESHEDWSSNVAINGRARARLRRFLCDHDAMPPTISEWKSAIPSTAEAATSAVEKTGLVEIHDPSDEDSTRDLIGGALSVPKTSQAIPEKIGRFRVLEKIGEGGMGAVYRATDLSNNEQIALKVLSTTGKDIAQAVRRFRKEARLLADAANPLVTKLIDVGEDGGIHYLAMEFIDGIDLKQWLKGRGPLPESDALQIAADLARALVEAHSRDVVHRDVKPENVLLQLRSGENSSTLPLRQKPIGDFNIKLSDFGIARHVTQSESMEMTRAGSILGTPKYMSPEQCKSEDDIGPEADVYSLGVTLYQLLTGRVPFESDDCMKLAAMHCFDMPPSVQKKVAEISDMTARIVDRALAKSPADRYGDAGQMLRDLLRTIRGDAKAIEMHPHMPDHDAGKVWEKTQIWDLKSEPADLWPLVANTERLNEAIGLPAVTYRTEKDPRLGIRKFGSFTISGIKVSWEEHPFEWIEEQRMGILREFDSGPFKWFMSVVSLDAQPGGGTRLSHQVRIEARNLLGRALTTIEADWKGFRNLKRVYQRIDSFVQSRHVDSNDATMDPFAPVGRLSQSTCDRIDDRIDSAISHGAKPSAAEALKTVLHHWASQELSHLRPLHIADQLNVDGPEMVDACLIAATEGLLNLRWDILCPACRASAATTDLLSDIDSHTYCEACDVDFKSNFGDAIEMVFCVHPEIRTVNESQYCIGGPEHSPHVVAQIRVEPGECLDLDINLGPGDYLLRGPRLSRSGRVRVESKAAPSVVDFTLSTLGGPHTRKLRTGKQTITLSNDLDTAHVVRIERTIPRQDVVTATIASANSTFRRLFPHQTFATETPVEMETVSLLATGIANVEDLYSSLGDTTAYALITNHHRLLSDAVTTSGGTIVKTIGEQALAAFPDRAQALEASFRIRQSFGDDDANLIELGIGIHCGPTLVTTANNQLDYFGGTVRAVMQLPEFAASDTMISEAVYSDSAIRSRYFKEKSPVETVDLPGRPNTRCKRIKAI